MKKGKPFGIAGSCRSPKLLLLMKLTATLMLVAALQISAKAFSQNKITLKLKSANFKNALQEIEKKAGVRFLYNDALFADSKKVSVNATEALLTDVLDQLFEGSGIKYKLLENNLVVLSGIAAEFEESKQDTRIVGKVVDSSGSPVAGASVTVKGSTVGVPADANGNFSINAATNAVLQITAVGYQPYEVSVTENGVYNITLSLLPISDLNTIVVVGYGTQRKADLTGSIASVKGAELAKQPVQTATQALQGKVAGVQVTTSGAPNALPTVRVRGTGTTLGGANPLYVVDGIITEDIRNINSSDIVSLDVLKDASATAIYGMRAANGVLLITTKKGRVGKMVISYDANVGIREATNLVDMAGPKQYANYLNEASVFYGSGDSLVPAARLAAGINTDWFDAILRQGFQQNHNISISGGSEKITYFLSAGYITDEGILLTNKFNRFTLRSNNEYKISNRFKVSTLISYSRANLDDANYGAFNNAYRAAPYVASKVDGKYGNTSEAGNVGNPVLDLEKNYNKGIGNRVQATGVAEYKPVSWLSLRSSFGVDLDFYNNTQYAYKYLSDNNTFLTTGGNQSQGRSSLGITSNTASRYVFDNTATLDKKFGLHSITALVGITAEEFKFNSQNGQRFDVPENRDQWYLNAGSTDNLFNSNSGDKFTRNSVLGRINYGYNGRYLVTATFRADGTSRFSKENRWGYFPSIALGWNITKEGFMQNQKLFNSLKLRASYGRVGNDQIPTSLYYSIASINVPYYFNGSLVSNISFNDLNDKNVRWELNDEFDIGLDFSLIKNKLSGEVDYYNKKTTDALVFVNIPAILGDQNNRYITNAGSFENKGVEVSLNWKDNISKNWSYTIGGNVAFNQNTVIGLNGGQALFDGNIGGNQGNLTKTDNGQPIGSFFILKAIGILQNAADVTNAGYGGARIGDLKYEDFNGDKVINDQDRQYLGSYIPKITYGINGSVNYKTFDLSFGSYGTQGSKIYNGKKAITGADPRDNIEANVANNRWTPNNTNTGIPRANTAQLIASSYFLESGDFFRLNNLTLGYTLSKVNLAKLKFSNLRIYVTSQNLFTITPYSGFTPELQSGSPLNGGIELNSYPSTRTFAVGVNLAF